MPKLWSDTIEAHRREVWEAILDTTWELVTEHGLSSVTMSQIAEATGIGRATLYKYFPDVEAILLAWHERHVTGHLAQLVQIQGRGGSPGERLEAVLAEYAMIAHRSGYHGTELMGMLHRGEHMPEAQRRLRDPDPPADRRGRRGWEASG